MMKEAIIGGGISGLTTAFLLKRKGVDVTLFEASESVGGNVQTITRRWLHDRTGTKQSL